MKKQTKIIIATLLGLALAACSKNETPATGAGGATPTPAPVTEAQMRQAYGFAAQIPADTASYSGFYRLGKLWDDLKASKTWASIKANPLVSKALSDESFQQSISQLHTDPEAAKWLSIAKDALGNEAFVALAPGSESKVHAWLKLNGDIRMARLQAMLTGGVEAYNSREVMVAAIAPSLKDLDIPPMILGFKLTAQKTALDSELAEAVKNLPPFVEQSTFTVSGSQFKSIAVTAKNALPPPQQDALKMTLGQFITDPQAADATYQSLLNRRLEIAYGYVGDYFVVSIGPDHSHLKFADNYAASLIAQPDAQKATEYAGKDVLTFSWASQPMMEACRQKMELLPAFEGIKQQLSDSLTPDQITHLEGDLKRIDTEGKAIFELPVTPMLGVEYRDQGLHGEVYGGVKYGAPVAGMKFSQVPTASTFIWIDRMANPVLSEAARVWFEDVCSTGWDTFQSVGAQHMSQSDAMSFEIIKGMAIPKLVEFYKITRDEFKKGLGLENAFAMDLNGEFPDTQLLPPDFHAAGKTMRLAILSDVRDRSLLAKSWDDYFKLANELAKAYGGEKFTEGLPQPENENADGVSLWFYRVPGVKGDVLPNVAVTDKTFAAGTSRSYSLELTKAAAAGAPGKALILDVRVNFQPAYDFAEKWLAFAAQNPDVFFSDNEDEAADFKKSEPDIASLIQSLRAIDGLSIQAYEENGVPRISSVIRWEEK